MGLSQVVLHVVAAEYSARTLLVPQMGHQQAQGFVVHLACAREGTTFSPELTPFTPIDVPLTRKMEPLRMARGGVALHRVIRGMRPAVVHLHGSSTAAVARALPRHSFDDARLVFTVHGFPFQWDQMSGRSKWLERLERALARRTDLMLFQSQEDLEMASERGFASRLRFLGNGVQDSWFKTAEPESHDGPLRALFTGRLTRGKGILELLRAMLSVPELTLVVAGGRLESERDDISPEVREIARDNRLGDRVTFLGAVSPGQMPAIVAACDVFVLPTYHNEGVPRSLLEAMAASRVCLATNVRGCREAVRDGIDGFLIAPKDDRALVAALKRLSRLGPAARHQIGRAARQRAWEHFRERSVLERLDAAYTELGVITPGKAEQRGRDEPA